MVKIVLEHPHPNIFQKLIIWFVRSRFGAWVISPFIPYLDRFVIKVSGGRYTLATLLTGLPIILLEYTGVKSGRTYQVPLVGVPCDKDVVIIGSNWGKKTYPGWYYNIKKQDQVQVRYKSEVYEAWAVITNGEERDELWNLAVNVYPGFANYAQRTVRVIPVIRLVDIHRTN